MYRKDTFEVIIELDNNEEIMDDVYYTEDSTVTYSCELVGETDIRTEVKGIDDDIAYEDSNGKRLELSEEIETRLRDKAFASTEEEAHEEAWEARYDDR